jgi:hypothetical protein
MRRPSDVSTITCPISVRERDALNEMKSMTGIAADANLMRVALYRLAVHLQVNVDTTLFAVRQKRRTR